MDLNFLQNSDAFTITPATVGPYDNGGITWKQHGFMGPGNKVVDKDNKSNFKQLPDKCTDWVALEHDVDYHNLALNGRPSIQDVAAVDDKAISAGNSECASSQPWSTKVLEVGLSAKQHFENLAEAAVYPFGSNTAVYPRSNEGAQPITWFTQSKSRRKDLSREEAPVVNEQAVADTVSEGSVDGDLQWDYDGGVNPNTVALRHMASTTQPSTSTSDVATSSTSDGGSVAKKRKTTALPGTGNEDAADADTGNPSLENATIPSAPNHTTGYRMVFRKHHTLVSYGVANIQLQLGSTTHDRIGTTNLMYIPVDKPYFYLSPSEFFNLVCKVRGVRVIETKCKVVLRNPRTAFETNASTSNLATLNQNKFIQISHGLINKTRGLNLYYKFGTATNPMKPTSVSTIDEAVQKKFICAAYGVTDALAVNFSDGSTLPCSFFNLPMQFPVYYGMYNNSNHNGGNLGWQNINKFIDKKDASGLIGKTLVEYSYKPQMGLLTQPWGYVYAGRCDKNPDKDNDFQVFSMGLFMEPNCTVKSMETGKHAPLDMDISAVGGSDWLRMFPKETTRYFNPIECSQYITNQNVRMKGTVQPSLHVGVCPVPQLTTTTSGFVADKFTDVEGTFDIDAEIVLEFGIPFDHTHYNEPHVPAEHHLEGLYGLSNASMFREDLSVFDNQYIVTKEKSTPAPTR